MGLGKSFTALPLGAGSPKRLILLKFLSDRGKIPNQTAGDHSLI
jgi:hypothetical protein